MICAICAGSGVALAQEPAPTRDLARDFTFKRVRVGDPVPGKRITVQIDPVEQAALLALLPKASPVTPDLPLPDAADRPLGPLP